MKRLLIGFGSALALWITACLLLLTGAMVSSVDGATLTGGVLYIPGYITMAPGLLGLGLIDYLPMYLIFPDGGASGVFGSVLIFALLFWAALLGYLSCKRIWPFKTTAINTRKSDTHDTSPFDVR